MRHHSRKEKELKITLLLVTGLLCILAGQVSAQETKTNPSPMPQVSAGDSEGPDMSGSTMSGGAAVLDSKIGTTGHQDSVYSQQDGETARLQKLYRGVK